MNTRNLTLAGLLLIGTLGASDYIAPKAINISSISGAPIADSARSIEINHLQLNHISGIARIINIASNRAIDGAILNHAIGNITTDDIKADLIDAGIKEIEA